MDITSRSESRFALPYRSAQFRYAVIYILVTFCALLFLNIFCAQIGEELFANSKEASMTEKCKLAAASIADLEALNASTAQQAVANFEGLNVSRLLITDAAGLGIYDSFNEADTTNQYVLYPEIISALDGNNVFYWKFTDSIMRSTAAVPVFDQGVLIGCVYMMELDEVQGTLFATLQNNIFSITLLLEIIVILFSFAFSNKYSRRLRRIMRSIRIVREGDYTHKLTLKGHDELNTLSNEFNDLISKLEISEMKRSRFVSDASHELKTPLASIKLLSDSILQNDMDIETIREFVADIGNEADRLNRMSQKLLTLSRVDSNPEQEYEITTIAPTIDRVLRLLKYNAEEKGIRIIREFQCDNPIFIQEDDLFQIIFNLVENGIKYNIPNGSLTILLTQQDDNAIIRITDTGVGIPNESIEHIFERFYRVDKARSRKSGGSGLGLSIVRNMVERNHGHICVSSTLGKGTAFEISFPIISLQEEDV